jgi:hypothetical protein
VMVTVCPFNNTVGVYSTPACFRILHAIFNLCIHLTRWKVKSPKCAICRKGFYLLRRYHALFPERDLYIVSKGNVAHDPAYAGVPIHQIPVEYFVQNGVDIKHLFPEPCFLVLDDVDSYDMKQERQAIAQLTKDVLNLGRKLGISVAISSHLLTDYQRTRGTIFESQNVFLYPRATLSESIAYFARKLGLTDSVVKTLKSYGRWCMIRKQAPMCILGEHEARILA